MMKRKGSTRLFCTLLTVILLFSTLAFPTTAVTLDESALPELPLPSTEAEEATVPEAEIIESEKSPYLLAGDLTFEELQTATLSAEDIPEVISTTKIAEKQHVNRLREQETGLNSIVFQNRNGSKTEYIFNSPVKYVAEDGSIRDIRTQPVAGQYTLAGKAYTYAVTEHSMLQYFPAQIGTGVLMEIDGHHVSMTPISTYLSLSKKAAKLQGNAVLYEDVFASNVDVKYTPTSDGIKEDILLSTYPGMNSFPFLLKTDGLAIVEHSGGFCFVGADDATRATLGKVIVYDSAGHYSAGSMSVEEVTPYQSYRVTLHVDEAFLQSPDTVYPVTVDPRIFEKDYDYYGGDVHTILDYGLYKGTRIPSDSDSLHSLGYKNAEVTGRVLYKLPVFVQNGCALSVSYTRYTREQIGSVTLHVYGSGSSSGSFKAYPITQNWATETNAFANDDLWDACTASSQYVSVSTTTSSGYITVDITDIVREWADFNHGDTTALNPARGFALVNDNEVFSSACWLLYTIENTQNNVYVEFDYALTAGDTVHFSNRSTGKFMKRLSDTSLTALTHDDTFEMIWIVQYHGNGIYTICDRNGRPLHVTASGSLQTGPVPTTWTDHYRWQMLTSSYGGLIVQNIATGKVLYHANNSSTVSAVAPKTTSDANYWNTCWGVAPDYRPLRDFKIPEGLLHYNYNNAAATVQMFINPIGEGVTDWTNNHDFIWSVSNSTFSITSSYSSSGLLTTYQYGGVTDIIVQHKMTGLTKTFRFVCGVLKENTYYTIRNKRYGNYLEVENPEATGSVVQESSDFVAHNAAFTVQMSSPSTFYIIPVYKPDWCLQVKGNSTAAGGTFELGTREGVSFETWAITKTTSGNFRISPEPLYSYDGGYAVKLPYDFLDAHTDLEQHPYTNDGDYSDEWIIEPIEQTSATINIYYDTGFLNRYFPANPEDPDDPSYEERIVALQQFFDMMTERVAEHALMYTHTVLSFSTPQHYQSKTDRCPKTGAIQLVQDGKTITLKDLCPDHQCVKDAENRQNNICPENTSGSSCTSWKSAAEEFRDDHPGNETTFNVLFTGHTLYKDDIQEQGSDQILPQANRSFSFYLRGEYYYISMQTIAPSSAYSYATGQGATVFLHEIAHQLGVNDHYHEEDDDGNCEHSEICSDCGVVKRPSTCIMNNTGRDIDDLNENHFCPGCRCDALTYIINDRS